MQKKKCCLEKNGFSEMFLQFNFRWKYTLNESQKIVYAFLYPNFSLDAPVFYHTRWMRAYTLLLTVYLPEQLKNLTGQKFRNQNCIARKNYKLLVSRTGFFYRTTTHFNNLQKNPRHPTDHLSLKRKLRPWVARNIQIKPGLTNSMMSSSYNVLYNQL